MEASSEMKRKNGPFKTPNANVTVLVLTLFGHQIISPMATVGKEKPATQTGLWTIFEFPKARLGVASSMIGFS